MAKPPFHRLCGTSHWSTERCPGSKPPPAPAARKQNVLNTANNGPGDPSNPDGVALGGKGPIETMAGWKKRALDAEAELADIKAKAKARLDKHRKGKRPAR